MRSILYEARHPRVEVGEREMQRFAAWRVLRWLWSDPVAQAEVALLGTACSRRPLHTQSEQQDERERQVVF